MRLFRGNLDSSASAFHFKYKLEIVRLGEKKLMSAIGLYERTGGHATPVLIKLTRNRRLHGEQ